MTTDTTESSLQQLQDLIHEKYGIERADLGPEASMRDKGFDSLALVEFLFAVEDHFKISLPDTDENMTNLGQLAALVDQLRAKKAATGAAVTAAAEVVSPAGGSPGVEATGSGVGTVLTPATPVTHPATAAEVPTVPATDSAPSDPAAPNKQA